MISHQHIVELLEKYDPAQLTVGVLGGHSALDVCHGAKKYGFKTVAVCQKGREKTYTQYYKTRPSFLQDGGTKGCIDEVIVVDSFADVVKPEVQDQLRALNTVFVHNRYFWVYCDFAAVENDFLVPIVGTRTLLKLEERHVEENQYYLLEKAGIRFPRLYEKVEDIDTMVMVKVNEAERQYERAFFVVGSAQEYKEKSEELLAKGIINEEGLAQAVIEEFIVGAHVNFNYFYSPLNDELELMGTDVRRQTSLDGFLRMTADQQLAALKYMKPSMVENGHIACTVKESLLEKAFEIGERFVRAVGELHSPGLIGPFALQGAVTAEKGREEIIIFDVSLRIPGSPGTRFTPYSGYLYGESISYGERIAADLRQAVEKGGLEQLLT